MKYIGFEANRQVAEKVGFFYNQKMLHELMAAKEAAVLLRRDVKKYTRGVMGMYLLSSKGMELGSTFRSAYYFVRHIDDVSDGNRIVSNDPLAYVQDLRHQVESGHFKGGLNIGVLAHHAISNLEKRSRPGDNPRGDFLNAIDGIIFDHLRSRNRQVLTNQELEEYYRQAFDPVVNLMLIGVNSVLRTTDMPIMSYGQGRVYSARDLTDDWTKGVINVPAEKLQEFRLSEASSVDDITTSPEIRNWFKSTFRETKPELINFKTKLKKSPEHLTYLICSGLINPLLKFIDNYNGLEPK